MKIYRLILVLGEDLIKSLNKNVESTTSKMKAKILDSYKSSQVFQTYEEDILIGKEASSERLIERINHYVDFSQNRLGKLELIVCSSYMSDEEEFIQLYEETLKKSKLKGFVNKFEKDFLFEIKHVRQLKDIVVKGKKKSIPFNETEFDTNLAMLRAYSALIEQRS